MDKNIFNSDRVIFFDGAMGTMLQKYDASKGVIPEELNITHPKIIEEIHKAYIDAGADIITANTFGANSIKCDKAPLYVESAVKIAKKVAGNSLVALDIGPTGKLMEPIGDLSFEDAYNSFYEIAKIGENAGADLVIIETMSSILETKSAILAVKETTNLPVIATMTFGSDLKTLTGNDVLTMISVFEGLGVDALGVNCGFGPDEILKLKDDLFKYSSTPIIIQPNAGLPIVKDGKVTYDVTPNEFAKKMSVFAKEGAHILGGCCGTTPEYIKALKDECKDILLSPVTNKDFTVVSSASQSVIFDEFKIIGERINPTGKKKFKEALIRNDIDYIINEAIKQKDAGAHILDVNVGLPDIDETKMLTDCVKALQSACTLPLQLDSSSADALSSSMRIYSGKPMVNSVNGKEEVLNSVLPLVKKYGGVVVGLTLDENGIPETSEGRLKIAKRIVEAAKKYGIDKKNVVIDALTMAVASDQNAAKVTLDSLKLIKDTLNVKTVLGVSNVSFALPNRACANEAFTNLAIKNGLDCAIKNPCSEYCEFDDVAINMLLGKDKDCSEYIRKYTGYQETPISESNLSLYDCIVRGLKNSSAEKMRELLKEKNAEDIITESIIPALNHIGEDFASGKSFLPQLMASADSAKSAFDEIKQTSGNDKSDKIIVIATVEGDIHDIGKNIVKMMLENYGFCVLDLGRDVPCEKIVETAKDERVSLIGLSALMTTTVSSMEKTIRLLREAKIDTPVMVGGAVLNENYAKKIGATYYAEDALVSVEIAKKVLN